MELAESERPRFHISRTEKPNGSVFERHCHAGYELLYVSEGRGIYTVEGTEYPLLSGTVMLFRPFEYHFVKPEPGFPYERYVLNFSASTPVGAARELPVLEKKPGENGIYYPCSAVSEMTANAFHSIRMAEQFTQDSPEWMAYFGAIVTQILLLLGKAELPKEREAEASLASQVITYLNEHLDEDFSLDRLAKRFFVSKFYLCRAFRQSTGTTVLSYLNTKRVVLARQFISRGETATSAALRVGFRDYSSFYRTCIRLDGTPPVRKKE